MKANPRFAWAVCLGLAVAVPGAAQDFVPPKLGGYIQLRETAQEDVGLTATLNRARFSIEGPLPSRFSYRFLVELEAATGARTPAAVGLREAMIRWAPGAFAMTMGQFKTPFSREYLIPVPALETPDFAAVVDSIATRYDVGVMAEYLFGPQAIVLVGVFNGEGQNATANRDSTVLGVGRLVVRPFSQIAFGANTTWEGGDSLRWGVETQIEERGLFVRSEYLVRHRNHSTLDDDYGWYVLGMLRVLPQVQLLGREEDFQRPAFGTSRRVRATTIGTIVEVVPGRIRLLLDAVRRTAGTTQTRVDTLIGQLQIRF